jgi:hypothetical protein
MDLTFVVRVQTRDEDHPACIGASDISDALAADFNPKDVVEVEVMQTSGAVVLTRNGIHMSVGVVDVAMQNVEGAV